MFLFMISVSMLQFFIGFNEWIGLRSMVALENHIDAMTNMILIFGLAVVSRVFRTFIDG